MPWFIYATLTPALYGVTNFVEKFLLENKIKNPVVLAIIGGFISLLIGFIIFVTKEVGLIDLLQTVALLIAGMLLTFYLIPYYEAIKSDDVSRVLPLFQFVPVFVLVLSFVFLGETLSFRQLAGFVLVFLGGFFLCAERVEGGIFRLRRSLWYMLLSGFMYAVVMVIFRGVVKTESFWTTLSYEYFGMGIGSVLLLVYVLSRQKMKGGWGNIKSVAVLVSGNAGIGIIAQMCEAYALSLAPAAFVSVVGGTHTLFILIYGLVLSLWFPTIIKEDIGRSIVKLKLFTILLILIGLGLIYF